MPISFAVREIGIDVPGDGEFGKSMGIASTMARGGAILSTGSAGWILAGRLDAMSPRQSRPGEIVLMSFSDRRDRVRFAEAYADREFGHYDRASADTGPVCVGPLSYTGQDAIKNRHRAFQDGVGGGRGRGRIHDLDRARQRHADRQRLLQDL